MKKYIKLLMLLFLLGIATLFIIYAPTIFQEGNPLPVAYGILKLSVAGDSYAKLDEQRYIVKANATDIKKLTDYLAQNNLVYVDQMGAGLLFTEENGEDYTAIKRMYTTSFEIWDFSKQAKPGLVLP